MGLVEVDGSCFQSLPLQRVEPLLVAVKLLKPKVALFLAKLDVVLLVHLWACRPPASEHGPPSMQCPSTARGYQLASLAWPSLGQGRCPVSVLRAVTFPALWYCSKVCILLQLVFSL